MENPRLDSICHVTGAIPFCFCHLLKDDLRPYKGLLWILLMESFSMLL